MTTLLKLFGYSGSFNCKLGTNAILLALSLRVSFEPRSEKTGLRGFRPGPTHIPGCTAKKDG